MSEQDKTFFRSVGCGTLVIVALIFLLVSIKIVSPGQAVVVTKSGQLDPNIRKEGIYLALPLESYNYYNLQVRTKEDKYSAGSRDAQYVYIDLAFSYTLKDENLTSLYSKIGSKGDLEAKLISPVLSEVIKQVTAQFGAEEILQKRGELKDKIEVAVREQMNQEYITIGAMQVTNIDFSEVYNKAIEDKQVAQQNAEKEKYELERTKIEAERQRAQAETLTQEILQKMWIEKWNGILPTTMTGVDANLYLPVK